MDQIVGIFQADGKAHHSVGDAKFGSRFGLQPLVSCCRWMGDEALGVSEIVGNPDNSKGIEEPESVLLGAFHLECHDLTATAHLTAGQRRLWVIIAAWEQHAIDTGVAAQMVGDLSGVVALGPNADGQSFQPL